MINPRPANKKGQTGSSSNTTTTGSSTSNTKNTTQASTSTAQAQSSNKSAGNKKPKGNGIRKLTQEEMDQFSKENRCWSCHEIGHRSIDPACPRNNKALSSSVAATVELPANPTPIAAAQAPAQQGEAQS